MWKEHFRSIFNPRGGIARAKWRPPEGTIAVADDQYSAAAVVPFAPSVVTVQHRALVDAIALRQINLSALQEARAERRGARRATLTLTQSKRTARGLRGPVRVVPAAIAIPPAPVALVDAPVAALAAHWGWPPNKLALSWLLDAWPDVTKTVPGATLLLAGRGLEGDLGPVAGVRVLGEIGSSLDLFSQASVLAFPCPPSCGPKIKVLEALAHGLPTITTEAGVEGLCLEEGEGALVVDMKDFATGLAQLLASPEQRAALAKSGRAAVSAHHSPIESARCRLAAISEVVRT
jgi:hypothetical protein